MHVVLTYISRHLIASHPELIVERRPARSRYLSHLIFRLVNIRGVDGRFLWLQIKVITVIPLSQPFKFNARSTRQSFM